MSKILLIGGCGYIGSALYEHLKSTHIIDTVDLEWFGNFVNPSNMKMDFDELTQEQLDEYDVIVFTAANSSANLCKNVADAFDNNVIKFVRLVEKLKKQKFIYASSSCVYTNSNSIPRIETDYTYSCDGLTLTKITIDNYMLLSNVEFYGLRFGSVNGWSLNTRLDLIINAMTLSALHNKNVVVYNEHAYRPIVSIRDMCRAVTAIIQSDKTARGIYNIVSFNENIGQIGKRIAEYMNVPLINKGITGTYDFSISSEKFVDMYQFEFNDSIEDIVTSIINNPYNNNWSLRNEK